MQEKQAQRENPVPEGEKKAVPVAVKRWRNVLDLIHTEQAKNPRLALKDKQEGVQPQPRKEVHFEAPQDAAGDVVTAL